MTIELTTLTTSTNIVKAIKAVLPIYFNRQSGSGVDNMLTAMAESFKLNIQQLNQFFNNTFISQASGTVLDGLIKDISGINRKDDESDPDYVDRYYKYIYEYNITRNGISEIVYDITGEYPLRLYETNQRAYWGEENLPPSGQVTGVATYYDDVIEYQSLWGDDINDRSFIGYIYLYYTPSQQIIEELCDVIERVRMTGTTIYLVLPSIIQPPEDFVMYDIT
jgi:hypothetical protein